MTVKVKEMRMMKMRKYFCFMTNEADVSDVRGNLAIMNHEGKFHS